MGAGSYMSKSALVNVAILGLAGAEMPDVGTEEQGKIWRVVRVATPEA